MKQHKLPTIALLMLMSATCLQVHAQGEFDLDELEEGQFILNLSAAEQLEVEQDTLNASLQFIAQGRDRIEIQQEVNSAMQAALDTLEDSEGVEYSISNYRQAVLPALMWRTRSGVPSNQYSSTAQTVPPCWISPVICRKPVLPWEDCTTACRLPDMKNMQTL